MKSAVLRILFGLSSTVLILITVILGKMSTQAGYSRATPTLAVISPPEISLENLDQISILDTLGNGRLLDLTWGDGETLFIASSRGLWRYDLDSADLELHLLSSQLNWGINSAIFSPDGTLLAGIDIDGNIQLWDTEKGRLLTQFEAPNALPNIFSVNSKNGLLAYADSGFVHVWNIQNQHETQSFEASHTESLALNTEGTKLAYSTPDGLIRVQSLNAIEPNEVSFSRKIGITSLWFISENHLVAAAIDGSISVLDLELQIVGFQTIAHNNSIYDIAFNKSDAILATAGLDDKVHLWNVENMTKLQTFSGGINVALSPDGLFVATGNRFGEIEIWERQTALPIATIGEFYWNIHQAAFQENANIIAFIVWDIFGELSNQNDLRIWDLDTNGVTILTSSEKPFASIAFNPEGNLLALGTVGGQINLLETRTWSEVAIFHGHEGIVESLSFSPAEPLLVSTGRQDGEMKLWDVVTLTQSNEVFDIKGPVYEARFNLEGTLLVFSSTEGIVFRDMSSRKESAFISNEQLITNYPNREYMNYPFSIEHLAFSPNNRLIAAIDNSYIVNVWSIDTLQPISTFSGHTFMPPSIEFGSDNEFVLFSGFEETFAWDISVNSQSIVEPPPLHGKQMIFSQSGETLIVIEYTSIIRVWGVEN